jgi:hypothetical protein
MTLSMTKPTLADEIEESTISEDYGVFATQRGPRAGRMLHRSLMNWSGICESSKARYSLVLVGGSVSMAPEATHLKPLRPAFPCRRGIQHYSTVRKDVT